MLGSSFPLEEVERAARFDVRAEKEEEASRDADLRKKKRSRRWGTVVLTTSLVIGTAIVLMVMRLLVLIVEAYTLISTERTAEDGFVDLCAKGTNRESLHMRQACMRATVDRSSPIIFGALTRGTYTFLRELYTLVSVPFQAVGLVGAISLIGVLPWIDSVRRFVFPSHRAAAAPAAPEHTIYVLNTGDRASPLSWGGLHQTGSGRSLSYNSKPLLTPPALGDGFEEIDLGSHNKSGKWKMA
jgi:hypothetical protein